jgi:hypothetical protein
MLNVFESVVHKEQECSEKWPRLNVLRLCCGHERFDRG